ncbi:MAG: hypothetical protein WAR79_14035 [Melioribacteraceae bacterium]
MKNGFIYIGDLNSKQLLFEFENSLYYKWGTVCLLRFLNLPTLSCLIIFSGSSEKTISKAVEQFSLHEKLDRILIRTDGGLETGNYIKGGNSFSLDKAVEFINKVVNMNRAAILMTPTNRFINELTVNMCLAKGGSFFLEILGPGFDLADLNRGIVNPEIIVKCDYIDWKVYEKINPLFVKKNVNSKYLIDMQNARLEFIGKEILPAVESVDISKNPLDNAREWLLKKGYNQLFSEYRPNITMREIQNLYEIGYLIGNYYSKKFFWEYLVVGMSDLGQDHGIVFWDIVNPLKKFLF